LAIIQEVIALHIEMLQERGESLLVDQVEMAIVEANVQ
jgi:predicted RNase H-like HicB family nuclease